MDKYSQKSLKRIYLREKHAITIIQKQPLEVFYKVDIKNFTKITRKHLCRILYFKNVAGLKCFPLSFVRFLRTLNLQKISGRLLLIIKNETKHSHTKPQGDHCKS